MRKAASSSFVSANDEVCALDNREANAVVGYLAANRSESALASRVVFVRTVSSARTWVMLAACGSTAAIRAIQSLSSSSARFCTLASASWESRASVSFTRGRWPERCSPALSVVSSVASQFPGVAHFDGDRDIVVGRRPLRAIELAVGEGRVAQAVAERVQGLALEIAVGAALHTVIVEGRQLVGGLVEGDGKASGGVVIAEQDIGDGGAAGLARIPRLEQRRHVIACPVHGQRATVEQHQHDGFAERGHFLQQRLLRGG